METQEQININETITNQMAICGVTQGFLEVRGLKYVLNLVDSETCKLRFVFKNLLTIDFWYNEGKDLYQAEAYKGGNLIYKQDEIFCEDFKEVFERIFLKA